MTDAAENRPELDVLPTIGGAAHLCGPAVHPAALLDDRAAVRASDDPWQGTVIAPSQRAEETRTGAASMIQDDDCAARRSRTWRASDDRCGQGRHPWRERVRDQHPERRARAPRGLVDGTEHPSRRTPGFVGAIKDGPNAERLYRAARAPADIVATQSLLSSPRPLTGRPRVTNLLTALSAWVSPSGTASETQIDGTT